MRLTTASWLSNGRPRQFMDTADHSRCSTRFPFEVPGGKWHTVMISPGAGCKCAQPGLPGPDPVPVRAAGIGGDQQATTLGVEGRAHLVPPTADGGHRQLGGVVVVAHR